MSRLHALVHRPRRTLAALATVLVAVGITAASGASFTATSANPGNSFATGTLSMTNTKSGTFVLSASGMRPGDPATTGTVDIANTGTLSGAFTLSRSTPNDSDSTNPLSTKLNLVVTDCGTFASGTPVCGDAGDQVKYTGTLAAMSGSTAMGTYAGGEKHRYEFSVTLDSSAGNVFQGDSSVTQFDWNAA